ncbi:DoxX-like family protein [Haloarcula salinisoli]|uniref:DoxX-like family protein n=1 Tax=Haloarcula salinisoli TaxID=2487746 RepID=A0A8J7YFQ3_9EURY|nr:DoxX-like family protein [Halomicroarcula salinisoli]MBX0285989.1 DoxX-like family protein [Halomicroarcula salinisoli]MBX0302523.1 DoxX-like family protein [Halomicroarcula salinisoli]
MSRDAIYVERLVSGPLDAVWERTQEPDEHERWDLRFSEIDYLPRAEGEPQRFTYATHVGFGLGVEGTGESVATNEDGEETTSVLSFRSDQRRSLISEGRGFWRYVETDDGLRFLTEYNYETRWGPVGALVDRLAFRPLLGWATALSFDVLARWVEDGTPPATSFRSFFAHAVARVGLALIWVYQGLVPKLLVGHPAELAPFRRAGLGGVAGEAVVALGVAELAVGVALLGWWRSSWLAYLAGLAPVVLTAGAVVTDPGVALGPYNPVVTTVGMAALGLVAGRLAGTVPTAANCLRTAPDG